MNPSFSFRTLAICAALALSLSACGSGDAPGGAGGPPLTVNADGTTTFDNTALLQTLASYPVEELSQAEIDSLTFMREEEKLAGDVYTALDAVWGGSVKVFGNIAKSELTHTGAVRELLLRYNLPDPAADTAPGVFVNPELQALYTAQVQAGNTDLVAALQVGMGIEELDIRDIQADIDRIDNQDIVMVYQNLLKGSRNHMRSFYKTLLQQGGSYTPVYIDQASFDAIVTSAIER